MLQPSSRLESVLRSVRCLYFFTFFQLFRCRGNGSASSDEWSLCVCVRACVCADFVLFFFLPFSLQSVADFLEILCKMWARRVGFVDERICFRFPSIHHAHTHTHTRRQVLIHNKRPTISYKEKVICALLHGLCRYYWYSINWMHGSIGERAQWMLAQTENEQRQTGEQTTKHWRAQCKIASEIFGIHVRCGGRRCRHRTECHSIFLLLCSMRAPAMHLEAARAEWQRCWCCESVCITSGNVLYVHACSSSGCDEWKRTHEESGMGETFAATDWGQCWAAILGQQQRQCRTQQKRRQRKNWNWHWRKKLQENKWTTLQI